MKIDLVKEIGLTEGVTASCESSVLNVKGPKGELTRDFFHPKISLTVEDNKIVIKSLKASKREKTMVGSINAHVKNMVAGVVEPFVYKLKICSGHFPMNVTVSGKEFVVKNFLGEAVPRKVMMPEGVSVKVNGTEIEVVSANKELAGQAAAKIESLCKITNRDIRIFQDGCYIINKAGKAL